MVTKDAAKNVYIVPAPLVNTLIGLIFSALMGIAGYMVIWAQGDRDVKAELRTASKLQDQKIEQIKADHEAMNDRILNHFDGHPARVEDQIDEMRRRVDRLEDD